MDDARVHTGDQRVHLLDELLLLLGLEAVVPLGQAGLPRPVLDQDELDGHGGAGGRGAKGPPGEGRGCRRRCPRTRRRRRSGRCRSSATRPEFSFQ